MRERDADRLGLVCGLTAWAVTFPIFDLGKPYPILRDAHQALRLLGVRLPACLLGDSGRLLSKIRRIAHNSVPPEVGLRFVSRQPSFGSKSASVVLFDAVVCFAELPSTFGGVSFARIEVRGLKTVQSWINTTEKMKVLLPIKQLRALRS